METVIPPASCIRYLAKFKACAAKWAGLVEKMMALNLLQSKPELRPSGAQPSF